MKAGSTPPKYHGWSAVRLRSLCFVLTGVIRRIFREKKSWVHVICGFGVFEGDSCGSFCLLLGSLYKYIRFSNYSRLTLIFQQTNCKYMSSSYLNAEFGMFFVWFILVEQYVQTPLFTHWNRRVSRINQVLLSVSKLTYSSGKWWMFHWDFLLLLSGTVSACCGWSLGLVIILPTSVSYRKVSPSSSSLEVSLFRGTVLITLYNVAKLPLGFVITSYGWRRNLIWKPGKITSSRAEKRVRGAGGVTSLKGRQVSSSVGDCWASHYLCYLAGRTFQMVSRYWPC